MATWWQMVHQTYFDRPEQWGGGDASNTSVVYGGDPEVNIDMGIHVVLGGGLGRVSKSHKGRERCSLTVDSQLTFTVHAVAADGAVPSRP